ncbi:hypothetical protein GCM10017044_28340 [Kordiimonas sediminis]|uniref:Methyl-accepting chemotaxis protein n=1 Tax=Kordiimonas sediminis TaxID=1735581 RepID=A0A919AZF3_9PROT|nr:methyl-accepting chemotaxis protein [Kordiimonas sediminis]GHF31206.1 hypothetical protein GCM10017044_28340 [Kordiimonas sediminis]
MMKFLKNAPLFVKLGLSLGLIVAVLIIMNVMSAFETSRVSDANKEVTEVNEIKDALHEASEGLTRQHNAVLYLLVTADRTALQEYQEGGDQYDRAIKTLKSKLEPGEAVYQDLVSLESNMQAWRSQYADVQLRLARNYVTLNQSKAMEVSGEPSDLFAEINKDVKKINDAIDLRFSTAASDVDNALTSMTVMMTVALIAGIAISVIAGLVMVRFVVRPIRKMTDAMTSIADGDLTRTVPSTDAGDEVGDMARAVEVFKENGIERQRLAERAKEQEEQERARLEAERQREAEERRIEAERQAEAMKRREEKEKLIVELITNFDESSKADFAKVADIVDMLSDASQQLTSASALTTQEAGNVVRAADESNGNVQSVASASEEMDNSVQEIAQQIDRSSKRTNEASEMVSRTRADMSALEDATTQIGNIMNLISDIAEQTNLLALNATIEAARAGDAGRGFAVVAGEVKSLANQTAKATGEIRSQIEAVQNQTSSVSKAMSEIETVTIEVTEMAAAIASAVEEQRAATQEISRSISHAAANTQEVSASISSVAEAARSNGEVAENVSHSSQDLKVSSDQIRSTTQDFIETIKSAALQE